MQGGNFKKKGLWCEVKHNKAGNIKIIMKRCIFILRRNIFNYMEYFFDFHFKLRISIVASAIVLHAFK